MVGLGRVAVVVVLGMLMFPVSPGVAATASVEFDVQYVAAPGETNDAVITLAGTAFRISDAGASITAGPGCVADGADVVCDPFERLELFVDLGDGDDHADLVGTLNVKVLGGPGNDEIEIVGGDSAKWLEGGPGNDVLIAGAESDVVLGNGGDDQLHLKGGEIDWASDGPGNDVIIGGAGIDHFFNGPGDDTLVGNSGLDLIEAVGMNLQLTPGTLLGQGTDTLSGIESALLKGGSGSNVINARAWRGRTNILARSGDDVVVGGFGRDVILAGGGDDRIAGRAGRDFLAGEGGNDVLFARDGLPDRVLGGPGHDRARVDRLDTTRLIEVFFF